MGGLMENPTHAELVKRIQTLEKQVAARPGKTTSIKPKYGFRTFAEQSPNMIFINKRGRIVYANKRCITVSSQFINLYPDQVDDEINHTLQQIGEFADADRSYVFQFSEDQKSKFYSHEWCAEESNRSWSVRKMLQR
jgi:hypothetical protein